MKVLITGGSGLLGTALTKKLLSNNIEVVHLTRNKSSKNLLYCINLWPEKNWLYRKRYTR